MGNKYTLRVTKDEYGCLTYRLYSSWNDSGTPNAIGNLQTKGQQPEHVDDYKDANAIAEAVRKWVYTGVKQVVSLRVYELSDKAHGP
jgi:hypothetical protein